MSVAKIDWALVDELLLGLYIAGPIAKEVGL